MLKIIKTIYYKQKMMNIVQFNKAVNNKYKQTSPDIEKIKNKMCSSSYWDKQKENIFEKRSKDNDCMKIPSIDNCSSKNM